jgi:hypothetical protein
MLNFTTGEILGPINSTAVSMPMVNGTGDMPAPPLLFNATNPPAMPMVNGTGDMPVPLPLLFNATPSAMPMLVNGTGDMPAPLPLLFNATPSASMPSSSLFVPTRTPIVAPDAADDDNVAPPTVFAPFPTVAIPPQAPQSRPPTMMSSFLDGMPSDMPSDAPSMGDTATCSLYPSCGNLTGDCCPSVDGVFLACCGLASVEETCSLNSKCVDDWGLTGSCCPTLTGAYLDCCNAVPDNCLDGNSANCTVVSTRIYVESAAPLVRGLVVVTTLLSLVVALMA